MNRDRLWVNIFLVTANILLFVIMGCLVLFLKWSGPGFAVGCLCGFCFYFTYSRIKHGYWT